MTADITVFALLESQSLKRNPTCMPVSPIFKSLLQFYKFCIKSATPPTTQIDQQGRPKYLFKGPKYLNDIYEKWRKINEKYGKYF